MRPFSTPVPTDRAAVLTTMAMVSCASALFLMGCSLETVNENPVSKDEIRQTVRLNNKDVRVCYEEALETTPMLEGRVVVEWKIGPDGRPLGLKVREASPKIGAVTPCLIEKMKAWVFPHEHPDTEVTVAYPFIFSENFQFKRVQKETAEKDAKPGTH